MNHVFKAAVILAAIVFPISLLAPFQESANQQEDQFQERTQDEDTAEQGDDDQESGEAKQDPDERFQLPAEDAVSRRDFMRTKLMFTQDIFEGLTMSDFDAVKEAIREVEMITEGEQWIAIDNDVYRGLTEDFKTATRRLKKAAETENVEATALRFYELSTRCIDCHQHIDHANYRF